MHGPFRFLQTMFGCEPRNYKSEYEAKMRSLESPEALKFYELMLEKNQARIDAQTAYRESFGIKAREAAELYKKEHPRYYDFDRIPNIRIRQY